MYKKINLFTVHVLFIAKDQRQEEITKFLDESFHFDTSMSEGDDNCIEKTTPSKGRLQVLKHSNTAW